MRYIEVVSKPSFGPKVKAGKNRLTGGNHRVFRGLNVFRQRRGWVRGEFFSPLLIVFLTIVMMLTGCALNKYKKKIAATEIHPVNLENIEDGQYEGFYDVYLINAKVLVSVEDNKIASIKLIEHKHDRHSGEPMIKSVIENQTLEVDTISGATNSCKTVLKAIEMALRKGEK